MCPFCRSEETRVLDSRMVRDQHAIRRRRQCNECSRRFTTYERVERVLPNVMKRDGHREPFRRDKVRSGVELACRKRPISTADMEALIHEIERHFAESPEREVTSADIGEVVLHRLRNVDEVAYVRFASVYREFSDVTQFVTELEILQEIEGDEGEPPPGQ
jgi:transcriptional repressor NrdR